MTLSPGKIPTFLAGDGTDFSEQTSLAFCGIHSLTFSIVLVTEVTPTDKNRVSSKTKPITKCRKEPAPKTISLWPTPALTNARSLSASDNSSLGDIPTIRQ